MTVVNFDFRIPAQSGTPSAVPAGARWEFAPSAVLVNSGHVVLPDPFVVEIVAGESQVTFTPSVLGTWYWIGRPQGLVGLDGTRNFHVPDTGTALSFYAVTGAADPKIVDIDPDTYAAAAAPSAAWDLAIALKANTADVYAKTVADDRFGASKLTTLPIYAYGNSMAVRTAAWLTTGKHYTDQLAAELDGGTVTSYAVGGTRIFDVLAGLINEGASSGIATPIAGSKFPGVSARPGLLILDAMANDIGHYPNVSGAAVPTALPANSQYVDGVLGGLRTALALLSSESRVEQSAAVFSGSAWTNQALAGAGYSGGTLAYTTAATSAIELTLTPPQSGPMAGKAFINISKLTNSFVMAPIEVRIDGVLSTTYTPTAWEQYIGQTGANVTGVPDTIPITLPVDGASHPVKLTHAGAAGNYLYVDTALIPSDDPSPILVMQRIPRFNVGTFTAPQIEVMKRNWARMDPLIKAVVAEFPHAIWVPSTITSNGLYSGDGIHPNDRGQKQIKNDLIATVRPKLEAWLKNRAARLESDGNFTTL